MSRNENRTGMPGNETHTPQDTDTPAAVATGSPEPAFHWSAPTEMVQLPSGGRFYPEGHPLHNNDTLEIRYMTAKEEDILTSQSLIKSGLAVDRMLENLIVDKRIMLNTLLLGDKNALIVASRVTGYGPEYTTNVTCPSCTAVSRHEFDLEAGRINDFEAAMTEYNATLTDDNRLQLTLPFSGVEVTCRFLTGQDEINDFKRNKKRSKNTRGNSTLTDMFNQIIVSVNSSTSSEDITGFAKNMPARDSIYLRSFYAAATPNLDLSQNFECGECGYEADVEVPLTVDFLWPKR
jgi:rubredoxin